MRRHVSGLSRELLLLARDIALHLSRMGLPVLVLLIVHILSMLFLLLLELLLLLLLDLNVDELLDVASGLLLLLRLLILRLLHLVSVWMAWLGALARVHDLLVLLVELEHLIVLWMRWLAASWPVHQEASDQVQVVVQVVVVLLVGVLIVVHLMVNRLSWLHKHLLRLVLNHLVVRQLVGLSQLVSFVAHALASRHHLHHVGHASIKRVLRDAKWSLLANVLDLEDVVLEISDEPRRLSESHVWWLCRPVHVEVFREVIHTALFHHAVERVQVTEVREVFLFELPDVGVVRRELLDHFIVVVNLQ